MSSVKMAHSPLHPVPGVLECLIEVCSAVVGGNHPEGCGLLTQGQTGTGNMKKTWVVWIALLILLLQIGVSRGSCSQPAVPTLTAPICGAVFPESVAVSLAWSPADGATDYEIEVHAGLDCSGTLARTASIRDTTSELDGLPRGLYSWRVRSYNMQCHPPLNSEWSECCTFYVGSCEEPPPPSTLSPTCASASESLPTDFVWSASPGATTYVIEIHQSTDCFGSPLLSEETPDTSLLHVPLPVYGNYAWRVKPINSSCNVPIFGQWSACCSFVVNCGAPPPCNTIEPACGSSIIWPLPTTFRWSESREATRYAIEIYRGIHCTGIPILSEETSSTGMVIVLQAIGDYSWRVKPINDSCGTPVSGPWSTCCSFVVTCGIPQPSFTLSPACGSVSDSLWTDLLWSASNQATRYRVEIYDGTDCSTSPILSHESPGTSLMHVALPHYGDYTWRVRPINDSCGPPISGPWSACCSFSVIQLGTPVPLAPAPASLFADSTNTVSLAWTPVDNADYYEVELYENADCTGSWAQRADSPAPTWVFKGLTSNDFSWHVRSVRWGTTLMHSEWSRPSTFTISGFLMSEDFEHPGSFPERWGTPIGLVTVTNGAFPSGYWAHGTAVGENDPVIQLRDPASLGWSDYEMSFDALLNSGDLSSYYNVYFLIQSNNTWTPAGGPANGYEFSLGGYPQHVSFVKWVNGSPAGSFPVVPCNIENGVRHRIMIRASAPNLTVFVDNEELVSIQDSTFTQGSVALGASTGGGELTQCDISWDNIVVSSEDGSVLFVEDFEQPSEFRGRWLQGDGVVTVEPGGFDRTGEWMASGAASTYRDPVMILADQRALGWNEYTLQFDTSFDSPEADPHIYLCGYFYVGSTTVWHPGGNAVSIGGPDNGYAVTLGAQEDMVWLWSYQNGYFSQFAGAPLAIDAGAVYRVRVQIVSGRILIWVNGTKLIDVLDDSLKSGTIAFRAHYSGYSNITVHYDNIKVFDSGVGSRFTGQVDSHSLVCTLGEAATASMTLRNKDIDTLAVAPFVPSNPEFILTPGFSESLSQGLAIPPGATIHTRITYQPIKAGIAVDTVRVRRRTDESLVMVIPLMGRARDLACQWLTAEIYRGRVLGLGDSLQFLVSLADSVKVDSAIVSYAPGGSSADRRLPMRVVLQDPRNDRYLGVIPSLADSGRGLQLRATLYRGGASTTFPSDGRTVALRTSISQLPFPHSQPPGRYSMISFPLNLDQAEMMGVLFPLLGAPDASRWRMWSYDPSDSGYVEVPQQDRAEAIKQGHAYWLATRDRVQLNTGRTPGVSTPTDSAFVLTLAPGWNMISNPFNFPIAWDSVRVDHVLIGEQMNVRRPYWWDPDSSLYRDDRETLLPFEGYWVNNPASNPAELEIPAMEATLVSPRPLPRKAADPGDWAIGLVMSSGGVEDRINKVGVSREAADTWDPQDCLEPPLAPGRCVSLFIPHPNWSERAGSYSVDMRASAEASPATKGYEWSFDVTKTFADIGPADSATLRFSNVREVPADIRIALIDRELRRAVDLRTSDVYRFFLGKHAPAPDPQDCRFLLIAGDDDFIAAGYKSEAGAPARTFLYPSRPNPANPATVVRYDLARPGNVRLRIYNTSGSLVKVLDPGTLGPGSYDTVWYGDDVGRHPVPSGVYFLLMETPDYHYSRKLLVVR